MVGQLRCGRRGDIRGVGNIRGIRVIRMIGIVGVIGGFRCAGRGAVGNFVFPHQVHQTVYWSINRRDQGCNIFFGHCGFRRSIVGNGNGPLAGLLSKQHRKLCINSGGVAAAASKSIIIDFSFSCGIGIIVELFNCGGDWGAPVRRIADQNDILGLGLAVDPTEHIYHLLSGQRHPIIGSGGLLKRECCAGEHRQNYAQCQHKCWQSVLPHNLIPPDLLILVPENTL